MTLHSWAGIGVSLDIPAQTYVRQMNDNAKHRWRTTSVLIIDEVSMISSILFGLLSKIGSIIRSQNTPFGGIQLILFGDFYQLPPVMKRESSIKDNVTSSNCTTSNMLVERSGNDIEIDTSTSNNAVNQSTVPYCFHSNVWKELISVHRNTYSQLSQIVRQKDMNFCKLLNEIRIGTISTATHNILLAHSQRSIITKPNGTSLSLTVPSKTHPILCNHVDDNYVKLLSLRSSVNNLNKSKLENIHSQKHVYEAKDYGRDYLPLTEEQIRRLNSETLAHDTLELKIGATVMLIKNGCGSKSLFNGSVGRVIAFDMSRSQHRSKSDTLGSETDEKSVVDNDSVVRNGSYPIVEFKVRVEEEELSALQYERKILEEGLQIPLGINNKGFRLLQKMGYMNGCGLGKLNQGRNEPIPFVHKMEFGVGATSMISSERTIEVTLHEEEFSVCDSSGEVVATRSQIPLMLAWGMTIHKVCTYYYYYVLVCRYFILQFNSKI
jgi:ATP-dependent DNA helicase PIF1